MVPSGSPTIDDSVLERIERDGHRHLLRFWDGLSSPQKLRFATQLSNLDWDLIKRLVSQLSTGQGDHNSSTEKIAPPTKVVRKPKTAIELEVWNRATDLGESALRAGKVAAILLAGGQGTRLGFPHPKGMFPIGPVSGKSLFEIFADQVIAVSRQSGKSIPYLIMTSAETHQEIVDYFQQHANFGLSCEDLFFFQQGLVPSLDAKTGELLLADKGSLRMSPDGHGGLLDALTSVGLFEAMRVRGIEYLFLHQVDNPLVKVCDPTFIGLHIAHDSEASTKVVAKKDANEKVGVAVDQNGRTRIIEYSDLPKELSDETDTNGELRYWAGNTAIHVFNRSFLERVANSATSLPWHRAIKKIPYTDKLGNHVEPEIENGVKFERFLFDTLPLAETALIVETIRDQEFAPLKNQTGEFSAEYVRSHMIQVAASWLKLANVAIPEGFALEISPRFAMSADDVLKRFGELQSLSFEKPLYLRSE